MTTLTGKKIANTYKDLLQVSNSNSGIDTTLRNVEDGEGTSSPLQLSNSTINLGGTLQIGGETLTATVSALNNIADLTGATGLVAVSGGSVFGRSIAVGSPLSVTNANGTEGNPTINLANSGVSVGSYGPMSTFTIDTYGRVTDVTAAATISADSFIGGIFDGSQLDIENNASIGGDLFVSGTANIASISASDVTFNTVSATTKIVTPIISATEIHATSISAVDVFANNLSFTAVSISAQTVNQLTLVSSAVLAGVSVATVNNVATLSDTMATSIGTANTRVATVNDVATLSATMATSIGTRLAIESNLYTLKNSLLNKHFTDLETNTTELNCEFFL